MLQREKLLKITALCTAVTAAFAFTGCGGNGSGLRVVPDLSADSKVMDSPEPVTEVPEVTDAPDITPGENTEEEEPEWNPADSYYKVPETLSLRRKVISSVSPIYQDDLLTGCEATGLTQLLNWYGYDVDKYTVADKYLPRAELRFEPIDGGFWDNRDSEFCRDWDGATVGLDFRTTFIGDPRRKENSYGCYVPCLVTTANNYFKDVGSSYRAVDISGAEFDDLFRYIEADIPVLLIGTVFLGETAPGNYWYAEDIEEVVYWQQGHHCMVLVGYDLDDDHVYVADPANGCTDVYDLMTFQMLYEDKGKNAMFVDTGRVKLPEKLYTTGDRIEFIGRSYTDSSGTEEQDYSYVDWSGDGFLVDDIDPDESKPYRVHLQDFGWVSYDSLKKNLPYFGRNESNTEPVAEGTDYTLRNVHSGFYLDSGDGNASQISSAEGSAGKFRAEFISAENGSFRLSTDKKTFLAAGSGDSENAFFSKRDDSGTQEWVLFKVSENENKYVIALREDTSLVLSVCDSEEKTDDTSNVFVSRYTASPEQMWYFEKQ